MKHPLPLFWLLLLLPVVPLPAAEPAGALANVLARPRLDLSGKWRTIVDPYDVGYYDFRRRAFDRLEPAKGGFALDRKAEDPSELLEYDFSTSPTLLVPRDWNSQAERLLYYEGTVWYQRNFDFRKSSPSARVFVYFGAANYEADVYLNGRKLGTHTGGFTPFDFEITAALRETGNSLVVRVNNRRRVEGVPTDSTDWWNYGGLTREVFVVEVPGTYLADYSVQLARTAPDRLVISVRLDGPQRRQPVTVTIPELAFAARLEPDETGEAHAAFPVENLQRWSPETPRLYEVALAGAGDWTAERMGFRTIGTRGSEILLNDRPVFLRGICLHEENPLRGGRAWSEEDARLLLGWARELGCNFVRLAHYPHNEHVARVADELGLLLWEEIPVYWTIQWDNPDTLANARRQLAELIARDHNRASVIVWSVANETPVTEARTRFLTTLIDDARTLDGTRLVSAAMEMHGVPGDPDTKIVDDPLGALTDLISFNQYVGWYDGLPEKCDRVKWIIRHEKPVVISEFGGSALEGLHAAPSVRFSEEFQEELYRRTLPMLQRIPRFSGVTPWVLADFRSPRRLLPGIQDGWNRKGLIGENGTRKKAFFVLRDFYAAMAGRAPGAAQSTGSSAGQKK